MKRYFSRRIFVVLALLVFFTVPCAFAATVTFEAESISSKDIAGFIMNFEGITDASFENGSAINGWFSAVTADKPETGVTQLEAVDLLGGNSMIDGVIGTLTYEGSISWSDVQFDVGYEFRDQGGAFVQLRANPYPELSDGGTVTLTPIPPAILLLGGGLISLIALRRRRS